MTPTATVVILGSTGPTGEQVLSQCLAKGYAAVAFVRNPEKITLRHDNLQIVKGDVFSADEMAEAFRGCSAVLSCLGYKGYSKNTFYEDTMRCVVEAMRRVGVKRLLALTSWYIEPSPDDPFAIRWIVRPLILSEVMASMRRMEHFLYDNCPDVEYTVIRPPHLTNGPVTGCPLAAEVDKFSISSRGSRSSSMSRSDVARFMLICYANDSHVRQFVAVATT